MTNPLDGKTKGEQDFCLEYTRRMLVTWAIKEQSGEPFNLLSLWGEVAKFKGWVRKDGCGLTAAGYKAAAAFLRR